MTASTNRLTEVRTSPLGATGRSRTSWNHWVMTYSVAKMKKAAAHIVEFDPAFAEIVESSPLCSIGKGARTSLTPFHSLVGSVIAQQVSVKAADSITTKLTDQLDGDVTPERVHSTSHDDLRSAGLSGAKAKTIKGLAHAVHTGVLDLEQALTHPDDSSVVAELTKLWGIGRWTAEMFLMFTMHRLDVWPTGDLAMRKGWNIVHGGSGDIDPKILEPLGDPCGPTAALSPGTAGGPWKAAALVGELSLMSGRPARRLFPIPSTN